MIERALLERQRPLERRDHLRAAGMTNEAIDIFENQPVRAKISTIAGAICSLRERWNGLVKDDAKALRIDLPAHDVERIGQAC